MRKLLVLLTLLLIAAAFFLPAELAEWGDEQLFDNLHVTAQEELEGFAESLQLPVAEKLLLLHSGSMTSMYVGTLELRGLFTTPVSGESAGRIEHGTISNYTELSEGRVSFFNLESTAESGDSLQAKQEAGELWDQRIQSAWSEIRSLQAMGGLPSLWDQGSELEFFGSNEMLYMDRESKSSFQFYNIGFSAAPYSIELTIDAQSGRVIAFTLSWGRDMQLNWGVEGASGFGPAWRDYWRMDSVESGWYNPDRKETLESSLESLWTNGDYNRNSQIRFTYDGQNLPVSLANNVTAKGGSLLWG